MKRLPVLATEVDEYTNHAHNAVFLQPKQPSGLTAECFFTTSPTVFNSLARNAKNKSASFAKSPNAQLLVFTIFSFVKKT